LLLATVEQIHTLAGHGELPLVGVGLTADVLGKLAKYIDGLVWSRGGIRGHGRQKRSNGQIEDQDSAGISVSHGGVLSGGQVWFDDAGLEEYIMAGCHNNRKYG
jgi:hypothetical protein